MIAVIGLGFVGLTTALGFAHHGYQVRGYDASKERRDMLKSGKVPFHEPGLEQALLDSVGRAFIVSDELKSVVEHSDVLFYCVGTPTDDNGADLGQLLEAIKETLQHINDKNYKVLVVKSTVPPSAVQEQIKPLVESIGLEVGKHIGLANNPEFLREGSAWHDFLHPDRIVIGCCDKRDGDRVAALYQPFQAPVHQVSLNTAEFIKYLSNTLLATLISFANEQSMIARAIGDIDIREAFHTLHLDRRWFGNPAGMVSYVYPGCGFGGYCLPKDVQALIRQSGTSGHTPILLKSVIDVNGQIMKQAVRLITEKARPEHTLAIMGLAFKPNSDDVRDTPAKHIIAMLLQEGYTNIIAYDPLANESFHRCYGLPIAYAETFSEAVCAAHHVVLVTAWGEFIEKRHELSGKIVHDLRYML